MTTNTHVCKQKRKKQYLRIILKYSVTWLLDTHLHCTLWNIRHLQHKMSRNTLLKVLFLVQRSVEQAHKFDIQG